MRGWNRRAVQDSYRGKESVEYEGEKQAGW
jgi:hypothetical protein